MHERWEEGVAEEQGDRGARLGKGQRIHGSSEEGARCTDTLAYNRFDVKDRFLARKASDIIFNSH